VKVVLGRVVGAHGIHGMLRVRYLGDGPDNLLGLRRALLAAAEHGADDPAPQSVEIEGGGTGRAGEVRLSLRGVANRDAAEALRGCLILAEESEIEALPEGEYYWYQLIGCRVELPDGTSVGTVREIWETGAHDVLVVRGEDGRDRLLPTAEALMQRVDPEQRRIVVADLPGLTDPI
jgi:16S rRNA processing protein RimM